MTIRQIYFRHPNLRVYAHMLSIIIIIINLTRVRFQRLHFRHQDQVANLANFFPWENDPPYGILYIILTGIIIVSGYVSTNVMGGNFLVYMLGAKYGFVQSMDPYFARAIHGLRVHVYTSQFFYLYIYFF